MFLKGGQTRKHCFLAIFPKGGQTRNYISYLESENSSKESTNVTADQTIKNETTNDPKEGPKQRRSAAEHANQALQTLIYEDAVGDLDQNDDEYKCESTAKDLVKIKKDEKEATEVIENGSGDTSEITQGDSGKEIIVCEYHWALNVMLQEET